MNFGTAIRQARFGQAVKRPSWAGYIEKVSVGTRPNDYNPDAVNYVRGDRVAYLGDVYVLTVPPGEGAIGSFDPLMWAEVDDYELCFHTRSGDTVIFTYETMVPTGGKVSRSANTDAHTAFPLTGELLEDFMADDWEVGEASDFESARSSEGRM